MYGPGGGEINPLITPFLNLLSLLYKSVSFLNLKIRGIDPVTFDGIRVISVDNLSFGGTGKTPLVIEIGRILSGAGIKFSIITRGYGAAGRPSGSSVQPSDDWRDAGDEVKMMINELPSALIFPGSDRADSIRKSIASGCRAAILDDGFQTTGIRKDLRIMLINPAHPYYYLRNFRFMARSEDLVLFHEDGSGKAPVPRIPLGKDQGAYSFELTTFHKPDGSVTGTPGYPVYGFSALGDNRRFKRDLEGFDLMGFTGFRDHHRYSLKDLERLERMMRRAGGDSLVCTYKDFIKIEGLLPRGFPLIYVKNKIKCDVDLETYILKKIT